jgi:hypothetical protein
MKHIEQVPSMTVIHLIAIKDNRIFDLKRKVEEMQKTLEWYADKEHYQSKPTDADFTEWDAPDVNEDGGKRASQALERSETK